MYDAIHGMSPYEQQSLRNERSLSHLTDEENVKSLQWGEQLNRNVDSVGDKIYELTNMMIGLGSDEGQHLNNPWCPSCGGRLVHPGEMRDHEVDSALDMAYAAHCNDCGEDFISYYGTDGVLCEECGSRNTVESGVEPYDLLTEEEQEDNENYICPNCDSEFTDDDIEMMFPVDASSMGAYTQQLANAKLFVRSWNHDLPLPQKIQMVQEMLMLIHDAGPLFNKFFGASSKDDTIEIMRFLDLLSGNDLSKWKDPAYRNQRLKQPWNR
jgi:DNA-directed RNA polymerase subunit RPC12/RpoP